MRSSCGTCTGPLIAGEVADAVQGRLIAGRAETVFTGVSIDSRSARKDELFIAIMGKRFDGHDFLSEALKKGTAGAIVSKEHAVGPVTGDAAVVLVRDTTKALQDLASWRRGGFDGPVAAITGSNGKTTTKDLTWAILSRRWRTVRTEGSKNNHIGLPLTLLDLDEGTEAAVVELGTSGFGEIRDLVSICTPDVGCITNVGPSHLEFFESVEHVAWAKAELLEGMRRGCPVVLNADDHWFAWLCGQAKGPVVSFGIHRPADFVAEAIQAGDGSVDFRLVANLLGGERRIRMPFSGAHNAYNALAAAATASQLGAGLSDIVEGLGRASLPSMRYEVMNLSGVTVINDAYNANPASMISSLGSFCEMSVSGRRILVCGDMLELGDYAPEGHRQVGSYIKDKPIDYVIGLGELAPAVVEAAFDKGCRHERSVCCRTVEEAVSALRDVAVPGDVVLLKGSRANGMESIVDGLRKGRCSAPRKGGNYGR